MAEIDTSLYCDGFADGYRKGKKDAEQRWIPCEERLPEEDKNVLVCVHFRGLERTEAGWNDHIKESWYVDIASHIDGNWTSYSDEYKVARNRHEVIAWMPLPVPYKGRDE